MKVLYVFLIASMNAKSLHHIHDKEEVPPDMLSDDDIGTKYTTTHRCFGSPCKKDEDK